MISGQSSVRRRLACDRCHSHKLQCPRLQGSGDGSCARCIKAGTVCVFSPSMRGVRMPLYKPTLNSTEGSIGNIENDMEIPTYSDVGNLFDNTAMDWSIPDAYIFDNPFTSGLQSFDSSNDTNDRGSYLNDGSTLSSEGRNDVSMSGTLGQNETPNKTNTQEGEETQTLPDVPSRRPKSSPHFLGYPVDGTLQSTNLLLDLVKVSMRLDAQARRIPPFSIHEFTSEPAPTSDPGKIAPDEAPPQQSQTDQHGDDPSNAHSFWEEPFHLSHSLIDIYPRLIHDVEERKQAERNVVDSEGGSLDRLDHSLLYLLFSCHHHLIDIWRSVLIHLKTYSRQHTNPAKRHTAHCPQMKMGSYTPSESTTMIPIELIMMQELASYLIKRVRSLVTVMDAEEPRRSPSTQAPESPDPEVNATGHAAIAAAKALYERAMDMHTDIVEIKRHVEEAVARQARITQRW